MEDTADLHFFFCCFFFLFYSLQKQNHSSDTHSIPSKSTHCIDSFVTCSWKESKKRTKDEIKSKRSLCLVCLFMFCNSSVRFGHCSLFTASEVHTLFVQKTRSAYFFQSIFFYILFQMRCSLPGIVRSIIYCSCW